MRLILLRHGQTHSNVVGALDTAVPGAALTLIGEQQAAAVPAGLTALLAATTAAVGTVVDEIVVSPLLRTQLTAAPLAAATGLHPTVLDGVREVAAGAFELRTDHDSQHEYTATAFRWARGDVELRMPGGETGAEFFARFDAAIEHVLDSGAETAVVVSHGVAIRTWVAARSTNLDGGFAAGHQLANTGLALLEGPRLGRLRLVDWHSEPVGGELLSDHHAVDPAGGTTEPIP
ncbi:histidine phosphatase family protein [Galbitalea soli]|uniref:Histidine phosphatase family protein n=1 Tax=Galbitalea soli TaxID=1268042 RepID=A0A7C9PNA5_9MICO|nr:histidine phosphatase family protein [Galbitalea soli]NEM91407.1 histidine phosphatase family protein [Galbitalea soli]NYJ30100.1 putative phosphoglycerate mutase [Galbitalea soli]